ncbi:phosphate--acyl-ACP acyltransferase [bacterium Unc6]|nr:phosphate--acyl-ACP acyltransferase [bacterium Unc6]
MRIALDTMGGDKAPYAMVEGAVLATQKMDIKVVLVGNEKPINKELSRHRYDLKKVEVCNATEIIEMHEPAAMSVRKKRDSSINVMVQLAKKNMVDAIISAGNTGAVVCSATLGLRMLEGIERPGIAIILPTLQGPCMLIDAGANIVPKPTHLLQYGIMGDLYLKEILKINSPRIGLLNVGEEECKGTTFIKDTYKLLENSELNFSGNVEGRDIFSGNYECIICDGFVGNVVLKISESLAEAIEILLRRHMRKGIMTTMGALLSRSALAALKKEVDYSEYGGAPLLGIDGCCIISHGRSSPKAIFNAIRVAKEYAYQNVNKHIVEVMKKMAVKQDT